MNISQIDHDQSAFIRKLDELAQRFGASIRSKELLMHLVAELPAAIGNLTTDQAVYGLRTEAMFAYIAAALGACDVIRHEDSGISVMDRGRLAPPDFRLLTKGGYEFLVEVKNHHKSLKPFRIREDYVTKLINYAKMFGRHLKLAIYWSKWCIWSLVDPQFLVKKGRYREITLGPAMMRNEMVLLGDYSVATVPPLAIRAHADPNLPRTLRDDGLAEFRIANVSFFANGREITDACEKSIAFYLALFGSWDKIDDGVVMEDGLPAYYEISTAPRQLDEKQGFQSVGFLSSMISKCYDHYTSPNGEVTQLTPGRDPTSLLIAIPDEYSGDALRLWRFHLHPKHAKEETLKHYWSRLQINKRSASIP